MSFVLDILYAITSNFILIIFGILAWFAAKKGKKSKGWFIAGIVVQGLAVLGSVSGMIRNPELWLNYYGIISIVAYVVLIAVFAVLIHNAGKK